MQTAYGAPGDYGATAGGSRPSAASVFQPAPAFEERRGLAGKIGSRGTLVLSVITPWLTFVGVSLIFMMLYRWLSQVLIFLATAASAACFAFGMISRKRGDHEPAYMLLSCALVVVVAALAGSYNYFAYSINYWEYADHWQYTNVGANEPAGAYRDASAIVFADDSRPSSKLTVDFSRGYHQYCVAPVLSATGDDSAPKINFWAVGQDCCGGDGFSCDSAGDASAHSGLVVYNRTSAFETMFFRDMDMYAQAIEMACAKYSLVCEDAPIFLRWVEDLEKSRRQFLTDGVLHWVENGLAFLPVCLVLGLGMSGLLRPTRIL